MTKYTRVLRAKQKFGKYVIERKLGEGGFAVVYAARDTIEGVRVALKMPYAHIVDEETLNCFRHEARIAAKLEHANILPLKHADFIEGRFVIVTALGTTTLEERLKKRISGEAALNYAKQLLAAVAFAHEHRVIHCDLKPENVLIFPENRLRLMDFGIARVAQKTLKGSGTGTIGYMSPEQAMGKPSLKSDVFSLGIILYRMFSGQLPEWPFHWPPTGYAKLKERLHADFIAVIRKAIEVETRRRYRDAVAMNDAFLRIRRPLKSEVSLNGRGRLAKQTRNWQSVRRSEFLRSYGKQLEASQVCSSCEGPVSEAMLACPWCGKPRKKHTGEKTRFQRDCPRCHRGLKSDWHYCPWCFGPGFEPSVTRRLSDKRYVAKCDNPKCKRKDLMPFMRYCPWCRRRVKKSWKIEGTTACCKSCGNGVVPGFWSHCAWCGKGLTR